MYHYEKHFQLGLEDLHWPTGDRGNGYKWGGGERSWHETRDQLVGQEDPEGQERELRNHSEAPRKYIIWWITF